MKTRKSITKRIKLTKTGKIGHRAPALGHARANKRSVQLKRKKHLRNFKDGQRIAKKYL